MSDLICAAVFLIGLTGATYCVRRGIRVWRGDDHRTRNDRVMAERLIRTDPPAIDTQPGTDTDLLWACRRIDAEPLADPDATRRLINDLRDTGEETP